MPYPPNDGVAFIMITLVTIGLVQFVRKEFFS